MHDPTPPTPEPQGTNEQADAAAPVEECPAATPVLGIEALVDPGINFAALHNDIPAVKRLALTNAGEADADDLELRLWIDRELSGVWTHRLDRLAPGRSLTLNNIALPLRAEPLAHITERDSADLHCEVYCGGERMLERVWPIDVLAFDEWEGLRALPELLAAFVTPNHPAIERLLGEARLHLERATHDGALSGYQRKDPTRVRATIEAICRAVGDLNLAYINPPASFEQAGQRVRLPDQVLERRMGTCLDITLLLAALFEQAGLHPLVVMIQGHAFAGVWLSDERFPEPAVTEPLRLRKRVQLGEVLVIETTGLTQDPAMGLEDAQRSAERRLDRVDEFHFAIDVRTARLHRIRPLPLRVKPGTYDLIDLERAAQSAPHEAPRLDHDEPSVLPEASADTDLVGDAFAIDLADSSTTHARLESWKRRLLDLSLRNRVLSHRDTKKTIPLEVPDAAALEDRLAEGAMFNILPRAELLAGDDPRSSDLHEQRTGEDARARYLADEMNDGRLYAHLTENELDKRLVEVFRAARLGLEESGANTLYLAVGFLSWYETPTSEPARLAPILLLPAGLERLPAGRGYRLSLIDEDPRINVTLLEKLRTEYDIETAGLEDLTEDETGLDVSAILRRFREVVRDIPRWDVIERADLGLFSFNKFLMWRDLHERSAQLAANPVVRRLVDPSPEPIGSVKNALPDPQTLDEAYRPDQTLCPMDADSSQLAAVFAADEGHSFVLEGPPGTGKSQTITNLIAHALSRGKRVLFVSEKRAALEVVHRRLEKIGLGPFSLELHSNKANKRAVLEQLGEALSYHGELPPEQWADQADDLARARGKLNALVGALHREHPLGLSVYQATGELLRLRDTPTIDLGIEAVQELDTQRHSAMAEAIDRLATAAHAVGIIEQHPYRAAGVTHYTAQLPGQLRQAITHAEEALQAVGDAAASLLSAFGLTGVTPAELSSDAFNWLLELGGLLASPCDPTPKLLTEPGFDTVRAAVAEQAELGRSRDAERARLMQRYDQRVFKENLEEVRHRLTKGMTALPILSWLKRYSPRKQLKLCLRPNVPLPSGAALLDDLDALIRVRDWTIGLSSESNPGRLYIGGAWLKGEAPWDEVLALLDWSERCRQHFDRPAARAFGDEPARREHMLRLAIDDRDAMRSDVTAACLQTLRESAQQLDQHLSALDELMVTDKPAAWGDADEAGRLDTIASTLEAWRQDTGLLRDWTHWCAVRGAARSLGLEPLITAHRARVVPAGQLNDVFIKSLLTQWHAAVLANKPVLAGFHRLDHERQIERFRALDERYLTLSAEQVRAELSRRLPLHDPDANANSEVGILNRQLKLKRRHMPVRRLIASLPNLLPRLKPCFLMSPLSVAQYLDTADDGTSTPFDLVVFDEASQIPVWDAVGALGRGASCVVVGDSKQLPPTNFFQKLDSEDESLSGGVDENDFIELESILDECSASGLPSMRLLWHYRSRHESLIAFSNAHYYDHRLNTFPSPADESDALGVTLRHIDGVYDRGDTRTNRKEAEALVADVVDRLRRYTPDSYRSIGVVTFSLAQQTLIEDLLDQARRDEPAIEAFFTDAVDEPVFVKNLENVQGDERAAIYFSVCYGPDESGKVAMNFGPLNREGGERRLNVAITRARERVALYSSLRAEQIDLSRTQAVGVAHLRGFLDYAERGAEAIIGEQDPRQDHRPTPIDQALAEALRDRGHTVDLHVGLSGYRVTLAVRDPDQPDAYLLGIELDGPVYESAATARDRDRTRPSVMRGLGWRLHRVWSLDFLHDPEKEVQRIEEAIERAKRGEAADVLGGHRALIAEQATATRTRRRANRGPATVYEPFVPSKPEGDAQAYYNAAKTARVRKTLIKICKREAPIHQGLLAKRLTLAWQLGRLTSKAAERAAAVVDEAVATGELKRDGQFVWLAEQDPERYDKVRVPADGDDAPRDIDEVPPQELEQAAFAVLRRTIAIPRGDLMREVAELFGLSRLTPRVQPTIDEAVQSMLDRGRCVIDGTGKVALP